MAGSPPKPPPPNSNFAMAGSPPKPPPPNFAVGSSSPKPPPPIVMRHPSDEQLIDSYLRDRVATGGTQANFIHEADLYSAHPNLLTRDYAAAISSTGQRAWYFFTPLRLKGTSKNRMKRSVDTGREASWVGDGKTIDVSKGQRLIGRRLPFQFKEKVDGNSVKSGGTAWRMMEFRLNPDEGGQELDSPDLLVLSKVYRSNRNAMEEGESSLAVANADADAPAASAAVMPRREGTDEEIGEETAAGPVLKKRKAGDKDSGAETVASSPGRQNKADGEIKSADAATTGQIFADGKDPLDTAEKAEQEPRDPRDPPFYDFMGVSSAPLDAPDKAEQEPRDPRDPPFYDFFSDSQNQKKG